MSASPSNSSLIPSVKSWRVTTYNVHRCLGIDGLLSPRRIAEVIAACEADIVGLQELDVGRLRTGGVDQAHAVASELGMQIHFHPAVKVLEELYGDAILTARPSRLVKAGALPGPARWPEHESRGALWAVIELDGVELNVINTHIGLSRPDRKAQVEELLGPRWLGDRRCRDPFVLLGDFNAPPRSRAYRRLAGELRDVQVATGRRWPKATFPAYLPVLRLDHVFVSPSVEVVSTEVMRTDLARVASDHLPLSADIRLGLGALR